jgi:hypothetical protein
VDKVFWFENFNKPKKNFKSPMAFVLFVVYALWGRMRQEYVQKSSVKKTVTKQSGDKFKHLKAHLPLSKLVRPSVIPHGTAKPCYNQPFFPAYP